MQCNQSFCGNGFTNGPFYSSYIAPLQWTQNMYPEIVGEGEVTSVTLPDGTIQFFFMPTVKWWSPNATQCHPIYPSVANTNVNIQPYNNNVGTWFVRSISNPLPQNVFNPSCQRNEVPRPYYNSDFNIMNSNNIGYQVKFHNDNWTSTTDLAYFYPSLRHRDYVFRPPCKGTAAVQIDTVPVANNTVCHYEVVCSKPCNCSVGAKPMSLESLVESKITTKSNSASAVDCACFDICKKHKRSKEEKNKRNKSKNICACDSTANIESAEKSFTTYTDEGYKRNKPKNICACDSTANISSVDKSFTTSTDEGYKRNKSKNICACDSTANNVSVDKKVTTYTDEGCNCSSADERHTQTGRTEKFKCFYEEAAQNTSSENTMLQRCEVMKAETWQPITSMSKRALMGSENLLDGSDNEW